MVKVSKLITLIFLLGYLAAPASACRYNVRDVGFAQLAQQPYALYCFTDDTTLPEFTKNFTEITNAGLMDTNVRAEVINLTKTPKHPAAKLLQEQSTKALPAIILLSPDGQTRLLTPDSAKKTIRDKIWALIDSITSSPKRNQIRKNVLECFGVVLLIEGTDPKKNTTAAKAASEAVAKITSQMKLMPKLISKPPIMLTLKAEDFQKERILLWSLGIENEKPADPYIAILYGRLRKMGQVIPFKDASVKLIVRLLSIIGADCECGLERKWMQGTTLPLHWGKEQQELAAKNLGFDPENPMVKMEMNHIIRQGRGGPSKQPGDLPNVSFGYREIEIRFDNPPPELILEPKPEPPAPTPTPAPEPEPEQPPLIQPQRPAPEPPTATVPADDKLAFHMPLYIIAISAIAVIAIGLIVILKAAGKKQK